MWAAPGLAVASAGVSPPGTGAPRDCAVCVRAPSLRAFWARAFCAPASEAWAFVAGPLWASMLFASAFRDSAKGVWAFCGFGAPWPRALVPNVASGPVTCAWMPVAGPFRAWPGAFCPLGETALPVPFWDDPLAAATF